MGGNITGAPGRGKASPGKQKGKKKKAEKMARKPHHPVRTKTGKKPRVRK